MPTKLSRRDFIHHAQGVALATPFLSLIGCSDAGDLLSLGGKSMGTSYSIKLAALPPGIDADALAVEIDGILETVNRQMSTYRPDSELSRFNAAPAGVQMPISQDTRLVIDEALRISRLTGGAFDPTIGPVVDLWGFGPDESRENPPSSEDIFAARATVGFAGVETTSASGSDNPTVSKLDSGIRLDLSGVAKGFGVDKVAAHLETRGILDYLVEVGGELRGRGHGLEGRPWRVGIEKPTSLPGDLQRVVELDGAALATSGDYRLFFEHDGRRYSHIIDPATGRPVDHDLVSVTVVAATTMEADALSTSLLVLGPEAGMQLAEKHGIAAYFIASQGDSLDDRASSAFASRFKV